MSNESSKGYKCFYKEALPDKRFKTDFKYGLMDLKQLEELVLRTNGSVIGVDTETNTLDVGARDPLVGISIGLNPYEAYYIPLRHKRGDKNQSVKKTLELVDVLCKNNRVAMYNSLFDRAIFENEGVDTFKWGITEVMVLVFNMDTNIKKNGLKWASKHVLGREVPTFEEVAGNTTFDFTDPVESHYYACCDAAGTLGIRSILLPLLSKECVNILKIDNALFNSMFYYMYKSSVHIDVPVMQKMMEETARRALEIEKGVFRKVGYPFTFNCVPSYAEISTDVGSVRADELVERFNLGDGVCLKTPLGYKRVVDYGYVEPKEMIKIRGGGRDLTISKDHGVLVRRNSKIAFILAEDLKKGDLLYTEEDLQRGQPSREQYLEALAEYGI